MRTAIELRTWMTRAVSFAPSAASCDITSSCCFSMRARSAARASRFCGDCVLREGTLRSIQTSSSSSARAADRAVDEHEPCGGLSDDAAPWLASSALEVRSTQQRRLVNRAMRPCSRSRRRVVNAIGRFVGEAPTRRTMRAAPNRQGYDYAGAHVHPGASHLAWGIVGGTAVLGTPPVLPIIRLRFTSNPARGAIHTGR